MIPLKSAKSMVRMMNNSLCRGLYWPFGFEKIVTAGKKLVPYCSFRADAIISVDLLAYK